MREGREEGCGGEETLLECLEGISDLLVSLSDLGDMCGEDSGCEVAGVPAVGFGGNVVVAIASDTAWRFGSGGSKRHVSQPLCSAQITIKAMHTTSRLYTQLTYVATHSPKSKLQLGTKKTPPAFESYVCGPPIQSRPRKAGTKKPLSTLKCSIPFPTFVSISTLLR